MFIFFMFGVIVEKVSQKKSIAKLRNKSIAKLRKVFLMFRKKSVAIKVSQSFSQNCAKFFQCFAKKSIAKLHNKSIAKLRKDKEHYIKKYLNIIL